MPNRKLALSILAFIFLVSIATELLLIGSCKANPFFYKLEEREVSPPAEVQPPKVSIKLPENNSVLVSNHILLSFRILVVIPPLPELFFENLAVSEVYFKASWLPNNTYFDIQPLVNYRDVQSRIWKNDSRTPVLSGYSFSHEFSANITDVPGGKQYIEVFVVEAGSRYTYRSDLTIYHGNYKVANSSAVNFTVDTTAPTISVLSPENKTYDSSDLPLDFSVNESVSKLTYVLDNKTNATITGNTTLTGLSYGEHNLTVYVWDIAGNIGAETINFYVQEPFITEPAIISAAGTSAIVAITGLLVFAKKCRH